MFLKLDRLQVRYAEAPGGHVAVDGVSLDLDGGQIGVLIGPSGCGKTTLLRALAGLEPPCGGRIEVEGEVLDDPQARVQVPAEQRRIGMVFQDYALFPHLSVAGNVAFGVHHLPPTQR
ncbi:MAG: ATP-binding cassette domain-containing protein, partial [Rubrivivax sp.]